MNRRLPILVEKSLAEAKAASTQISETYDLQLQARVGNEGLTCKKGCSNCCYHPVLVTLLEGLSLYQRLHENGLWSPELRRRVQEVSALTKNLAFDVWGLSLIPCPLLSKTNTCTVYDSRPFSCRITYSIGDPENCHPHNLGPGMLPKKELFEQLTAVETPILLRHHLGHFRIPLASALLYGERICSGEIDLEDCQGALYA